MNTVAIEKRKCIEFKYRVLYFRFWRLEFRLSTKWSFWTRNYQYINTGKIAGKKGFVLYFFPFAISYQITN
jgi:hypothetical protein